MGDRGQVHFVNSDIWLYTHYDATELPVIVQRALAKKWRWDDPEYLTRVVFSELIKDYVDGELGYGIGRGQHGDVHRVVQIDQREQTVRLVWGNSKRETEWRKEVGSNYKKRQVIWIGSFNEFIEMSPNNLAWYKLKGDK